jgi:hypothetical protein
VLLLDIKQPEDKGKGIKLTQDMVVKQALLDLFGVQEPE